MREDRKFADAREVLANVSEDVGCARNHVSTVGDSAATALYERASRLLGRLRRLEGAIAATKGVHHHAPAQGA